MKAEFKDGCSPSKEAVSRGVITREGAVGPLPLHLLSVNRNLNVNIKII